MSNAASKHKRADELKALIEEAETELGRLRRATSVEISNGRRGYITFEVPAAAHETDVLGELVRVPLSDRLGKNERMNAVTMFVDDMIIASELELEGLATEYEALFTTSQEQEVPLG